MTVESYLLKNVEGVGKGKARGFAETSLGVLQILFMLAWEKVAGAFYPGLSFDERVLRLFFLVLFLVTLKAFFIGTVIMFVVIMSFVFHETRTYLTTAEAVRKKYPKDNAGFTPQEYLSAAKALREFKPITNEEAVSTYGQRILDVLIIADCIHVVSYPRWSRTMSIEKIEKIRP